MIAKIALGIVLGLFVTSLLSRRDTRGCGFSLIVILALVVWNIGC